jgi:N-acetylglutamate synthase
MERVDIPDVLLGSRVSLRFRVGERAGRPLYRDAVGELAAEGPDRVLVRTRRGPVPVERAAVVAVRAVPPPPPRRASLSAIVRLEGLCADAWPTPVDVPLGAWRLRAAGGWTGRANAALAIGDPGLPIPAALDAVTRFADEHGIRPRVHAPIGSPWDRAVAAHDWELDAQHAAGAEVTVLVTGLDDVPDAVPDADGDLRIELPERPPEEWWRLALGGSPSPAQHHVLDPAGRIPAAFGLLRDVSGEVLGQVRAAVVEDHLHVSMLAVRSAARRQGHATALLAAAERWGREHGARWAVLQVAVHNTGARALYERLGWIEHHRYRYLVPVPPG